VRFHQHDLEHGESPFIGDVCDEKRVEGAVHVADGAFVDARRLPVVVLVGRLLFL
jgi:hypothetical protein